MNDCDTSEINLRRLSAEQVRQLDNAVYEQLNKTHIQEHIYTYNQIEPWEVELYHYIENQILAT